MSSVGREIESIIQNMLNISDEFAEMQSKLDKANKDVNMLETLFSVSTYIGKDLEMHVLLEGLSDSINGVFGASISQVVFDADRRHLGIETDLNKHLQFDTLKNEVKDILVIQDVSSSSVTTLDEGTLVLIRLSVGEELYGFLSCYWSFDKNLSQSSLLFLQIVSAQVSMYLKSAKLHNEFKSLSDHNV